MPRTRTAVAALTAVLGLAAAAAPVASAGPFSRIDVLHDNTAVNLVQVAQQPGPAPFEITGMRDEGWSIEPVKPATSRVHVWGVVDLQPNNLETAQAFLASGHYLDIELGWVTPQEGRLYYGPVRAQMRYEGGRLTFDSSFTVANRVLDWNKNGTDSLYAATTLRDPQGIAIASDATNTIAGEWGRPLANLP
jgi:hypothetical protein